MSPLMLNSDLPPGCSSQRPIVRKGYPVNIAVIATGAVKCERILKSESFNLRFGTQNAWWIISVGGVKDQS